MFKLSVFILFSFIQISLLKSAMKIRLNSGDVCILSTQNDSCPRKFHIECAKSLCAVSKKKCDDYNRLTKAFNFIFGFKNFVYSTEMNQFKLFKSSITKCLSEKRTWGTHDICLNNMNCHLKIQSLLIDNRKVDVIKNKICPCNGKHRFNCGKFCTTNKQVCKQLTYRKIQMVGIKTCSDYKALPFLKNN